MIHESWAKELLVHRSIVNVPDQKLGAHRTRVLLSQDDSAAIAANMPDKFKVDNFCSVLTSLQTGAPAQAPINDNPLDENFNNNDSIIGDNYPPVEPESTGDGVPHATEVSE